MGIRPSVRPLSDRTIKLPSTRSTTPPLGTAAQVRCSRRNPGVLLAVWGALQPPPPPHQPAQAHPRPPRDGELKALSPHPPTGLAHIVRDHPTTEVRRTVASSSLGTLKIE